MLQLLQRMISSDYTYTVCTRCFTYNHAPFIESAMNGFAMQRTSFPVVTVIVDDASTDETAQIIEAYLKKHFDQQESGVAYEKEVDFGRLIYCRHRTNLNCFFVVLLLKENHYKKRPKMRYLHPWMDKAKFLAICEGDDYWTDPDKLQKQVAFLENNSDYVICSHDYIKYFQETKQFATQTFYSAVFSQNSIREGYFDYSLDNYFQGWWTQPLTCLYRNGEYIEHMPRKKYKHFRDDIFYYYVLKEGKGALLRDVMGVYRVHDSGIWSSHDDVEKLKLSMSNAYDILVIEDDNRAIVQLRRQMLKLFSLSLDSRHFSQSIRYVKQYRRMVPLREFVRFMQDIVWHFGKKVKRKIKLRCSRC